MLYTFTSIYMNDYSIGYAYYSRENLMGTLFQYPTRQILFGTSKRDIVSVVTFSSYVDNTDETYYDVSSTLSLGGFAYDFVSNVSSYTVKTYLYFNSDEFYTAYQTQRATTFGDLVSSLGGVYSLVGTVFAILSIILLYGIPCTYFNFNGLAPYEPLDEYTQKRLDVYIAQKIINDELVAGDAAIIR